MANVSKESEVKSLSPSLSHAEKSSSIGKSMEAVSHDIGSRIGSMATNVSDRATEYMATTRSYVKENPIQSMAIAAATGAVLGSLATLLARRKQ